MATATMVMLGIMAVLSVVSVALEFAYANAVDSFLSGDGSFETLIDTEDARAGFAVIYLLALVVSGIVFIVWQQRARSNAERLGAGGQRYSSGLAGGCWFIPIGNLWLPKIVINDLWRASDPDEPGGYRIEGRKVAGLVDGWWALWIIGGFVSQILIALSDSAFEEADFESALSLVRTNGVVEIASVVAAVMALLIVKRITDRQRQRAARFGIQFD